MDGIGLVVFCRLEATGILVVKHAFRFVPNVSVVSIVLGREGLIERLHVVDLLSDRGVGTDDS